MPGTDERNADIAIIADIVIIADIAGNGRRKMERNTEYGIRRAEDCA